MSYGIPHEGRHDAGGAKSRRSGGERPSCRGHGLRRPVDGRSAARSLSAARRGRARDPAGIARHGDRRRISPQPDDPRAHRVGSAGVLCGPVHSRPRHAGQGAQRAALQREVGFARQASARGDPGDARDLGLLAKRHQARLPGRVLPAHADDAVLQPRADRASQGADLHRRRESLRRPPRRGAVRRLPRSSLPFPEVPPRAVDPGHRDRRAQGRPHASSPRALDAGIHGDRRKPGGDRRGARKDPPADFVLCLDTSLPARARRARLG